MYKMKPLSKGGIEGALKKAEQYRLLNQPQFAESICRDILEADAQNQKAWIILLLALTDQFGKSASNASHQAMDIARNLTDEYARAYYTGIIYERQGSAALTSGQFGADFDAYEWYIEAMEMFEKSGNAKTAGERRRSAALEYMCKNHHAIRPQTKAGR